MPGTIQIPWQELEAKTPLAVPQPADAIDRVVPARLVSPSDEQQVAEILRWTDASRASVCTRGGATKQGWANVPRRLDLVLSTNRMDRVLEHAWEDMTVTVQAGCTVAALQSKLAEHGQRLALDSLWADRATIGGIIATNDSGPIRYRYGSIRDLLIGATVVLANGTIARSGGKVVKNVAGYDLPKLVTGSFGTLGVVTEATFRVHPLPRGTRTLTFEFADTATANKFMLAVMDSTLVPAAMELRASHSSAPQVDVLLEGIEAGLEAQTAGCRERAKDAREVDAPADAWSRRERLFTAEPRSAVFKFSVRPSDLHGACGTLALAFRDFDIIAQATGVALARVRHATNDDLEFALAIKGFSDAFRVGRSGHLTLLSIRSELKRGIDVFGPATDSHPLMLRVKQRFDPNGILNPGRFLGGI